MNNANNIFIIITDIRNRATRIFLITILVFVALLGLWIYEGVKTKELYSRVLTPWSNAVNVFSENIQDVFKENKNPTYSDTYQHDATNASELRIKNDIIIQNNKSITPRVTSNQYKIYTYPTIIHKEYKYVVPTIKPGDLGSPEWSEQFEKDFNAAKQSVEDAKKKQEEMNADWCAKYPDSMFCK